MHAKYFEINSEIKKLVVEIQIRQTRSAFLFCLLYQALLLIVLQIIFYFSERSAFTSLSVHNHNEIFLSSVVLFMKRRWF